MIVLSWLSGRAANRRPRFFEDEREKDCDADTSG